MSPSISTQEAKRMRRLQSKMDVFSLQHIFLEKNETKYCINIHLGSCQGAAAWSLQQWNKSLNPNTSSVTVLGGPLDPSLGINFEFSWKGSLIKVNLPLSLIN
jgi:hypothetical protein